ncbi:DUF1236 domain-containing protein [Ramlibacter rhizophilus]|uniref:DUF1236 domain-containing protein n=1 Tax=Ramlibacter rhizophilus TaxID=1781167 RepID=A0A4Z0BFM8_9BURK|nr:DUF1236 domain-containing protein [Ramlibacter rhizophilus]TFY96934.1 DUF1236 domain-containing protein [Ramlibacter rhizophilus]
MRAAIVLVAAILSFGAAQSRAAGAAAAASSAEAPVPRAGAVFEPHHRAVVARFYQEQYPNTCPPGLSRKGPVCLPPGRARTWAVGKLLPGDVTLQPVPQALVVQLPPVPAGYRYVRVGADLMLLAPGAGRVVDIITALGAAP